MIISLKEWCKTSGVSYDNAKYYYKNNKLPLKSYKTENGRIFVDTTIENQIIKIKYGDEFIITLADWCRQMNHKYDVMVNRHKNNKLPINCYKDSNGKLVVDLRTYIEPIKNDNLINLKEWCKLNNEKYENVYRRYNNGNFPIIQKINGYLMIDKNGKDIFKKQIMTDEERKIKRNAERKEYYNKNKELEASRFKDWVDKNKESYMAQKKIYRESYKERRREIRRIRTKNDLIYKLKTNISSNIRDSLKRKNISKNNVKSTEILGCTIIEFSLYIESKFESWMNWSNYGNWNGEPKEINVAWDLDHIIPISTAITEEDVYRLNHYSNFQPLCSYINRKVKQNKLGI